MLSPPAASGEPDVVSLHDSQHHFIGEVKIFDSEVEESLTSRKASTKRIDTAWTTTSLWHT